MNRQVEQNGGEYVELLNYCISTRNISREPSASAFVHDRASDENDNYEKENIMTRSRTSRASLYSKKSERILFNPSQPLYNNYRTSEHDQMPIRVLPLQPSRYDKFDEISEEDDATKMQSPPRTGLSPPFRAASMDDLLMSAERSVRHAKRNSIKRGKCEIYLNTNVVSSTSLEKMSEDFDQTPRIEKNRPISRLNFNIFTRSSKRKSRSHFVLNSTHCDQIKPKFETFNGTIDESIAECCNNNETMTGEDYDKTSVKTTKTGKLSNLRNRIQRRFGRGRNDSKTGEKSLKRKNLVETNENEVTDSNFGSSSLKRRKSASCDMLYDHQLISRLPSLYNVLQDKDLREEFRTFLANEHSDENLDFWLICEKYKTSNGRNSLAGTIYRQFLKIGAPREVNLDAKTKSVLEKNFRNLSKHSFVPAQDCIYRLMDEDSYRRFCFKKSRTR